MKTDQIITRLADFGLSTKEATLYVGALELGTCSIQQLSDHSGVNRSSIYMYIDRLRELGVLQTIEVGKKRSFVAEEPERLFSLMEQRKRQAAAEQQTIAQIEQGLPTLVAQLGIMSGSAALRQSPNVKMYEGPDGIRQSYQHILDHAQGSISSYFSVIEHQQPELQRYFQEEFAPQRAAKNIVSRNIVPRTPQVQWFQNNQQLLKSEVRISENPVFPLANIEINLYADYLHCMSFNEHGGFALVLQNAPLVALQQFLFDTAWAAMEPV